MATRSARSTRATRTKRSFRTAVLLGALAGLACGGAGCAGFGLFEEQDSPPLPATIAELRAAIQTERALLKAWVSQPADSPAQQSVGVNANANVDELVAIAERLSRLQAAISELEGLEPAAAEAASAP